MSHTNGRWQLPRPAQGVNTDDIMYRTNAELDREIMEAENAAQPGSYGERDFASLGDLTRFSKSGPSAA